MNPLRSLFVVLLMSASSLLAQDAEKATSPDKSLFAAVRSVPESQYIWNTDLDGFRLVVFHLKKGDEIGTILFTGEVAARTVSKIKWSPDSRFIVLTTTSSGGHSPWHYKTYVFSVADKSLRYADDTIGQVTSEDFHFEPPNTVVLRVRDYDHEYGTPDDSKAVKVSLEKTYRKMPKPN